jgi:ribosome-binding protein aMBF1 (putative translation factor)
MKLREFRQQLETDPEYNQALEELQLKFDFGNAVLRARLNKNWSQAQLADAVGTKQANISRIEAGMGNTTFTLAQKILNVLDLCCHFDAVEPQSVQYRTTSSDKSTSYSVEEFIWKQDTPCGPIYKLIGAEAKDAVGLFQ